MLQSKSKEKYCLILSGGGAKGIYHIGAWRALSELGIEVDAFIGNSIGAIIAGFLAQGQVREMEKIGDNISADFIMNIPEEFIENGTITIEKANLSDFKKFYKAIREKKGIDVSPLRKILDENLSEKAIRKSGHDLGVVTFNVSDFQPQFKFLDEMEEGTVLDYLMASAAFPGMEQTVIGGKSFIDGGVVDNMPYRMARQRGYRSIIVVDISGMGINKKPDTVGTRTVYIKNSINMGGLFDFSRSFLDRYRELGYLDTKRVFGALKGNWYFFQADPKAERSFHSYIKKKNASAILDYYLPGREELSPERKIRALLPDGMKKQRDLLYCLADCAASVFQVERIKEYSLNELGEAILNRKMEDEARIAELKKEITQSQKNSLGKRLEVLFNEVRVWDDDKDSPYYDYLLCTEIMEWGQKILLKGLTLYHKELSAGLLAADFLSDYENT